MKHEYDHGLLEKIEKVEALRTGGGTAGERAAAAAALERVKLNLPVHITATVVNIDTSETAYEVVYKHVEGMSQKIRLPRRLFQRPREVVDALVSVGADLPDDAKAASIQVKDAIDIKPAAVYRITRRPGWHEQDTFVYPGATFGKLDGKLSYEGQPDVDPALGLKRGDLESWRNGLRTPCKYSDYLILALTNKAANPLLDIIGQDEGVILHLHGMEKSSGEHKTASSSGKSLVTRAAASMTSRCRKNDLVTFAISELGLGDQCYAHNHLGLELDEEGRALGTGKGPRIKADELCYLVPSGRGSVRSKRATRDDDLKNRTWSINAITSGELPLDSTSTRPQRSEGSQVRMIGIPVPPGTNGGIFNRVKGDEKSKSAKCKALAQQTELTIASNYGVVFPTYLQLLVRKRGVLADKIKKKINEFVERVGADTNPWERRFAEKFGVAYAAAILLVEFEIAPWGKKRSRRAITRMYRIARAATATVEEAARSLILRLSKLIEKDRFPILTKGKRVSRRNLRRARRGFQKQLSPVGLVLLMPMQEIEKFVRPGAIIPAVVHYLAARKLVRLGEGGKLTRQILVKAITDEKRRYLCFDVNALKAAKNSSV